jgi:hypothetical protein
MGMGQGEWVKGRESALGGSCSLASSGGPAARRCLWVRLLFVFLGRCRAAARLSLTRRLVRGSIRGPCH